MLPDPLSASVRAHWGLGHETRIQHAQARGPRVIIAKSYSSTTNCCTIIIIESVDSISRDERDVPLTQYITNA